MKIFFSPSDQYGNVYAACNTNEGIEANVICQNMRDFALGYGWEVGYNQLMKPAVKESNKMRPDLHLAFHTNASPKHNVRGLRFFYYSGSAVGRPLAEYLEKQWNDGQVWLTAPCIEAIAKPYNTLYEIKYTVAPCLYVEWDFHDTVDGANGIHRHRKDIAYWLIFNIKEFFKEN